MIGSHEINDINAFFDSNPSDTVIRKYKNNEWYAISKDCYV